MPAVWDVQDLLELTSSQHPLRITLRSSAGLLHAPTCTRIAGVASSAPPHTCDLADLDLGECCDHCGGWVVNGSLTLAGHVLSDAETSRLVSLSRVWVEVASAGVTLQHLTSRVVSDLAAQARHLAALHGKVSSLLRPGAPSPAEDLLAELAGALSHALQLAQVCFRDHLRTHRAELVEALVLESALDRGLEVAVEVERDEVLVGLTHVRTEAVQSSRLMLLVALFSVRDEVATTQLAVLRAPRFVAALAASSLAADVETAPLPPEGGVALAAVLWDPSLPAGLVSLVAASRSASEALTLAA